MSKKQFLLKYDEKMGKTIYHDGGTIIRYCKKQNFSQKQIEEVIYFMNTQGFFYDESKEIFYIFFHICMGKYFKKFIFSFANNWKEKIIK
ncbi:MAG: hypothetical protein N3A54_03350 [Patescibacteria group bacterium]|nr:hypothetical protein [Patescibacteria group bacterium]